MSKAPRERIILYALLTSLTAISIDALLPSLRSIALDFKPAPPLATQHVISLFIFGMAVGELLLGPISDAVGRKRALVLGLCVYGFGTLIALLAGSLDVWAVCSWPGLRRCSFRKSRHAAAARRSSRRDDALERKG